MGPLYWEFWTEDYLGQQATFHFESGVSFHTWSEVKFNVVVDGKVLFSQEYTGCEGPTDYEVDFVITSHPTIIEVYETSSDPAGWVFVGITNDCDYFPTSGVYVSVCDNTSESKADNPYPFVATDASDKAWVLATSDLILTNGTPIKDWYDNPENPSFPNRIRYWKFEGDKQDGRALPLIDSFGCGNIRGLYVRPGFDAFFYDNGNTDKPYAGNDECGNAHPVALTGPYYAAACGAARSPSNPDPTNFSSRTFFLDGAGGSIEGDGVIVGRRRLVILDIDGCRRDALYGMLGNVPQKIPYLSSVTMGRRSGGSGFLGNIDSDAYFTSEVDTVAGGDVSFDGSFQAVGVNYAYTVLPSYTFACQATLFTGMAASGHGILGNEWFNRFAGNFSDAHYFRRGYSGGSARSINQITRNYEARFIPGKSADALCQETMTPLTAGQFGWGGLSSADLGAPTVYEQLSAAYELESLISFNMYTHSENYHNDPNIGWVRPEIDDLCLYEKDDTGALYDQRMLGRTLVKLQDMRNNNQPFPDVLTLYFAGHDHRMHQLGNAQTDYLEKTVDPLFGRFLKAIRSWVDPENLLFAIASDHGHTQLVKDNKHSIIVEGELESALADMTPSWDVFDNIFEESFDSYIALNGGMAHVHLRNRATDNWSDPPASADLLAVAEALYHYRSEEGGEKIELVMAKDVDNGGFSAPYLGYDGGLKKFRPLQTILDSRPELNYVELVRRMSEMNTYRAGDLVLVPNVRDGYYFDDPQRSGHGSPYGTDSYIPMIFAGRALQRVANADRTLARAEQYDFAPTVAGLLDAEMIADGKDLVGPIGR